MSTDYGFLCRQCKTRSIIDNARYGMVDQLKSLLDNFDKIEIVRRLGLIVQLDDGAYYGVSGAFDFVREHRALGHEVVVGDEYGREHDQCGKAVKCGDCGASYSCICKEGHEGECKKP